MAIHSGSGQDACYFNLLIITIINSELLFSTVPYHRLIVVANLIIIFYQLFFFQINFCYPYEHHHEYHHEYHEFHHESTDALILSTTIPQFKQCFDVWFCWKLRFPSPTVMVQKVSHVCLAIVCVRAAARLFVHLFVCEAVFKLSHHYVPHRTEDVKISDYFFPSSTNAESFYFSSMSCWNVLQIRTNSIPWYSWWWSILRRWVDLVFCEGNSNY